MLLAWIGICIVMTAAISLYLALPNQAVAAADMPRLALGWIGWTGLGLGLGIAALLGWAGSAPAVFGMLTFAMLAWSVVPLLAAWLRHGREPGR